MKYETVWETIFDWLSLLVLGVWVVLIAGDLADPLLSEVYEAGLLLMIAAHRKGVINTGYGLIKG